MWITLSFCCLVIRTFKFFFDVTLENATYNCPWEKTGIGRYKPTQFNVCPWDLLMVIANAGCTGNWWRLKVKGSSVSEGDIIMRGMKTRLPELFPVIISASITCFWKWQQTNLVPLQRLSEGWILHNSIIGVPNFNISLWGGRPWILI